MQIRKLLQLWNVLYWQDFYEIFNWLKFASNYDVTSSFAPILESQSAISFKFLILVSFTSKCKKMLCQNL